MRYLRKLYEHREPPGMEWRILQKVPALLLGAVMIPLMMSIGGRLFPPGGTPAEAAKQLTTLDILSVALGITAWSAILTVAVGCIVVVVMKGPAYVADGYSPDDAKYRERYTENE